MSKEPRKIECEEAIHLLLEYLDHELESGTHDAMENHLKSCRGCFTRMEFENRLKNMIKNKDTASVPDELRDRIKKITDLY